MNLEPESRRCAPKGRMKRLAPEWYRGLAFVFWTLTETKRRTAWLDDAFHASFREIQLHTLARYRLICLSYCLMPDHLHVLWAGVSPASDQNVAAAFFHKYLGFVMRARRCAWQKQAWDVVLREADRERDALNRTIRYIVENPLRKNLVEQPEDWPWSGVQAPGYPELDWRLPDFHHRLWTIYELERTRYQND